MNRWIFVFVFGLFFFGLVSGVVDDDDVLEKFDVGEERIAIIVEEVDTLQKGGLRSMSSIGIEKIAVRGNRYTAFVSREELEALESDSSVLNIQRNIPLKVFMDESVEIIEVNESWNLKVDGINLTGASQSVCILDSGINNSHPDFAGRILAEKCYCSVSNVTVGGGCCPDGTSEQNNSAMDDYGHGTHVAGIVGANGGIDGVATGVGLVIVKIMDGSGDGWSYDLEDGMQWCIDNAATYNISVITASLGAADKWNTSCDDNVTSTTSIVNSAVAAGISVTVATGNEWGTEGITWPSCISSVTPVGAASKSDTLWYNRNSLVKLLGIGVDINSTCLVGDFEYANGYCTKDGTSMSTPMVAGAISVLNQVLNFTGQTKTPLEVENIFYDTGKTINESGNNYSRINLYDAILSVDNIKSNVTLVSPVDNHVNSSVNQTFVCNATDWQLANVTFKIWNSTGVLYNYSNRNLTGTSNATSFVLTDMTEDTYEWNCFVTDSLGNVGNSSNYTLTVGGVSTALVSPVNDSYSNVNDTNFSCRAVSDDSYVLSNVTFYLWNSSDVLVYNFSKNISGVSNSSVFNYSFSDEGNYSWNCFGVNNVSNSSWGDGNFSFGFDVVAPSVIGLSESVSVSGATISWTTDELANFSISGGVSGSSGNYLSSHSVGISGLSASTTYVYVLSSCDRAGNCANTSDSFRTSDVVISGSSSGGSGGSTSAFSVPLLFNISVAEIQFGYTKRLKKDDGVNFSIYDFGGGRHLLTVDDVGEDYVELMIRSEPISLKLGVGQSAKLNLTSPIYYDLFVKLNAIIDDEAELTIQLINESIEVEVIGITGDGVVDGVGDVDENYSLVFAVLIVIIIGIVLIVFLRDRKKLKGSRRRKKHGKKVKT